MGETRTKRKLELKNIYIKKYKGSNEISTRLTEFNEKKNEIYHQHHLYTENTIIDFVDDDCLAEIFMHVPVCERPKIALVCQKWRRALELSWGNVKKLELTHWEYDEYSTCLKKYPTLEEQFSFLKSLLFKCGHYLTELDLTAYGHCNILPVINEYCPNLVKLRLRFTSINHGILFHGFSRLSRLKVLAVIFQDFKDKYIPYTLIKSLQEVATLTDLILSNWKDKFSCDISRETVGLLRQLKALRRLEIGGIRISEEFINYQKNKISLYTNYNDFYDINMSEQFKNIEVLNLGAYRITDDGLYTIANTLKQVKKLNFFADFITNDGVVTISKMNLLVLGISGLNNIIDSSSIELLKSLSKLRLPTCNNITDDVVMKVLENSPKMDLLYLKDTNLTVEFIKKAAEISRNRKLHLTLVVSFLCEKKKYESPYLEITIIEDEKSLAMFCKNLENLKYMFPIKI